MSRICIENPGIFLYIGGKIFSTGTLRMVTHYFTLAALMRELEPLFRSSTIGQVFTQQKNELIISVDPLGIDELPRGTHSIHVSVDPKLNYFFVDEGSSRAKRNSADVFQELAGSSLQSVTIQPFDRTLKMALADGRLILIQLYDSAASNIYLTDENLVILNAFKNRRRFEGKRLLLAERQFEAGIIEDPGVFRDALQSASAEAAFPALKAAVPVLGSTFTREALHRAKVDEQSSVRDLDKEGFDRLFREVGKILAVTGNGGAYIYYRGEQPAVLSVVPLQHLSGAQSERFESVNRAIKTFIGKAFRSRTLESEKKDLLGAIRKELDRARRSLEMAHTRPSDALRAEEFERLGRLIMGNLYRIEKGTARVALSDPYPEGKTVTVTLNPALTPARNAEEYFNKARKARVALTEVDARVEALEKKVSLYERMRLHLDNCHTREQVSEFKRENARMLRGIENGEKSKEERLPFRIFEVAGGFQVLVGKSSANNDLLTTRYSKPNDLWFHARGASGSHTVMKVGKGQQVPREAIRDAAAIAAYYSKMRNASNVPVAYCERKYVRKPRGTPPGTVTLEREEILFVKPRLP